MFVGLRYKNRLRFAVPIAIQTYLFYIREEAMPNFDAIKPGLTAERVATVDETLSITHTKVPMLSTPKMIDLMEGVCKDLAQSLLPDGCITVGYEVHVKHKAAAPMGTQVKTWCKVLEANGRKLLFEVRVTAGDKIIGEGQHRRTIIPYSD
jgi:fluoroacetyl-CoA thioesterase